MPRKSNEVDNKELLEWVTGLYNYSISYYPLTEKQREQEERNYKQVKNIIKSVGGKND